MSGYYQLSVRNITSAVAAVNLLAPAADEAQSEYGLVPRDTFNLLLNLIRCQARGTVIELRLIESDRLAEDIRK